MDGIGVRLATITGLNVLDYSPASIFPPAATVSLPEVSYDSTMGRGCDDATFTVLVLVSRADAESARDEIVAYMAGSGSKSVKAAIEGDVTLGGAADTTRVVSAAPVSVTLGGVDYIAAEFVINVVA